MDNKNKDVRDRMNVLAKKWQEGTLSPREKQEFEEWYASFDDSVIELEMGEDIISVKERIYRSVENEMGNPHSKRSFVRSSFFRIAAALLVFSIAAGNYFYTSVTKTDALSTAKHDIAPGGEKAILILSDGSKVELDGKSKDQVLAIEGAEIERKDGQLVYTAGSSRPNDEAPVYHTIQIPRGGTYELTLPDGTNVWLNAATTLRYPTDFFGDTREVELSGEAYFEVAKDENKPFIVKSKKFDIEVLGTHFNVNAYDDNSEIETMLYEGKVKIVQPDHKSVVLKPMQQATVNAFTDDLDVKDIDSKDAISWKDGDFVFDNELITNVMKKISRWYDVEVVYDGPLPKARYVGKVSRYENVSQVLKMLALTNTIHFKVEERRITVMD